MQSTRNVLTVFLASPSDVTEERHVAERAVAFVNLAVGREIGWHVEIHKWEDVAPGYGRPQGLINPMVDQCDLFVGLLWERWGQSTQKYSSGFEEEFERAKARRAAYGSPEIWLVFKDPDPNKLRDPGEQLRQVLSFKASQQDANLFLFAQISDLKAWDENLRTWLIKHLLQLSSKERENRPDLGVTPAREGSNELVFTADEPINNRVQHSSMPRPLSEPLGRILQDNALATAVLDDKELSEFDVARLYLLSHTLISRRYTSATLETHELNLLYKHRSELPLTSLEKPHLLRAAIQGGEELKPAWFWFNGVSDKDMIDLIISFATDDASEEVRAGALNLLAEAKIMTNSEVWSALPLHDESIIVRQSVLRYLSSQISEEALSFINRLSADEGSSEIAKELQEVTLAILAEVNPDKALCDIANCDVYLSDSKIDNFLVNISKVNSDSLTTGLKSSNERVRLKALKESIRRGSLANETLLQLRQDEFLTLRAFVYEELAKRGLVEDLSILKEALGSSDQEKPYRMLGTLLGGANSSTEPNKDSIRVAAYSTWKIEQILAEVDWFSTEGSLAYKALALYHFQQMRDSIRSELRNEFIDIRARSIKELKNEVGPDAGDVIVKKFADLEDFLKSRFVEAALTGLAEQPEPADADLARPYLQQSYSSTQRSALSIVAHAGDNRDVPVLINMVAQAHGEIKREAAAAALKLSSDPLDIAQLLLKDSDSKTSNIGFAWLLDNPSEEVESIFLGAIDVQNERSRKQAVMYFYKHLPTDRLEALLAAYLARRTYYYNVVTELDRLLYSPNPFREMYLRRMGVVN